MNLALGLVALAALAGEPAETPRAERVAFDVHTFEVAAGEWRTRHWAALNPQGRQGASQIWTAPRSYLAHIEHESTGTVALEKQAKQGEKVTLHSETAKLYVTGFSLTPGNGKTAGYQPQTDSVADGIHFNLSSEETAGGLTTSVQLHSSWVSGVRDVEIKVPGSATSATVQMPQVVTTQVKGSWTVAPDDVLIVSLGQHADGEGKIREKMAVIDARIVAAPASDAAVTQAAYFPNGFREDPGSGRQVAILAIKPMPKVPSRSLLAPIGPDGKDAYLPPLPPTDNGVNLASFTGPPAPLPSAQSVFVPHGTIRDDSVAPASLNTTTLDTARLSGGKPQTFRVSLGTLVDLEINAKVVPKASR